MPSPRSVLFSTWMGRSPPLVSTKIVSRMFRCGKRLLTISSRVARVQGKSNGGAGDEITLAAHVDVAQLALAGDRPAEHAHVAAARTDLEGRKQLAAGHVELQ